MRKTLRLLLAVVDRRLADPPAAHAAFGFTRTWTSRCRGPGVAGGRRQSTTREWPRHRRDASTERPSKIAVLLNKGDGTFADPTYIPACDGAFDTELGDVTTTGADLAQDGKARRRDGVPDRGPLGRRPGGWRATAPAASAPRSRPAPSSASSLQHQRSDRARERAQDGGPPLLVYMTDFFNLSTFEQGEVTCASWDWTTNDCFNRPHSGGRRGADLRPPQRHRARSDPDRGRQGLHHVRDRGRPAERAQIDLEMLLRARCRRSRVRMRLETRTATVTST